MEIDQFALTRRRFLAVGGMAAAGVMVGCKLDVSAPADYGTVDDATLVKRPAAPTLTASPGVTPLGLSASRDSYLYVPASYNPSNPAPLLVMLHGAGALAQQWMTPTFTSLADETGVVLVAPTSSGFTWDLIANKKYGGDARIVDEAMGEAFKRINVDPARIALGGFSDGASYALSLGLVNGDLFNKLIAFAPGVLIVPWRRGTPGVYIAHGVRDDVINVSKSRDLIVPTIVQRGYTVSYFEFEGGHEVPIDKARQALNWLATGAL